MTSLFSAANGIDQQLSTSRGLLRPLTSILAGILVVGVLMQLSGYPVWEAYGALGSGATGLQWGKVVSSHDIPLGPSLHLNLFLLAQALAKVTPLLFAGLSVGLGLQAGLFNIGAQGQMVCGALAAALVGEIGGAGKAGTLPSLLHVPLVLVAGGCVGAAWGALPGLLKAKRGVHEVLSTIMLNYVAINLTTYLLTHDCKDQIGRAHV